MSEGGGGRGLAPVGRLVAPHLFGLAGGFRLARVFVMILFVFKVFFFYPRSLVSQVTFARPLHGHERINFD